MSNINKGKKGGIQTSIPDEASFTQVRSKVYNKFQKINIPFNLNESLIFLFYPSILRWFCLLQNIYMRCFCHVLIIFQLYWIPFLKSKPSLLERRSNPVSKPGARLAFAECERENRRTFVSSGCGWKIAPIVDVYFRSLWSLTANCKHK